MIRQIFSIYDSATEMYSAPFYCLTIPEAVRTFSDAVNDPQSPFGKHPECYFLNHIGTFEDSIPTLDGFAPKSLGCADQFITKYDDPVRGVK